ncbi:outer membrane protein assembly factor BamB family protein [Paractinoplanes globisporus]|uniref:PQQ-binding-like beta-propeller repeat protein n=1 Tax=Paractinoplanes globisporus TaxID=113565 RepID=A0ABW6W7H2_9ACTN|nr:PQQ-binding-like beta-propeller repeat protein [Actinoplanes globisporus]
MTIVDLDIAPEAGRRPRRAMPSRSVALFLVGLLTLFLVNGSVRPSPPFGGVLWSAPYDRDDDTMTLTPASLYLFHHDAGVPALKAYDLASGALRWSVPAPDVLAQAPSVAGGVIVAPDDFERYFNRPDLLLARTTRTIARDVHTGLALWRAAGAPEDVTDQSVLLVDAGAGGADQLRNVSLRDGRTLWSRPVPGLASLVVVGDAVVTAAANGRLTVLRHVDGAVTRTGKVPWSEGTRLSAAAGRLIVTRQDATGQTSTVYRPDTLAGLWQADGPLTDCRPVLCGVDPGGLIGYDPDTGARRWQASAMTVAQPVGDDRIVASSELTGAFRLLDPATGRRVGTAGDRYLLGALIGCRSVPGYLVCVQNARITVTAVR